MQPKAKRKYEFLEMTEGLPAYNSRKRTGMPVYARFIAAAASLLFVAGIALTLKLNPKPDTGFPGTDIVTEAEQPTQAVTDIPSKPTEGQSQTEPATAGTAQPAETAPSEITKPAERETKAAETASAMETSAAAKPSSAATKPSGSNKSTALPAQTSAGKGNANNTTAAATEAVPVTISTQPAEKEEYIPTFEEKERIIMKAERLAAMLTAAAIGTSVSPIDVNASTTPAHKLDRYKYAESVWDMNSDGKFDFEDIYYAYLSTECNTLHMDSRYFPEPLGSDIREKLFNCNIRTLCCYYLDQYIGSEADIEALEDQHPTYFDWHDGKVQIRDASYETTSTIDTEACFNMLKTDLIKYFRYTPQIVREEERLQAFYDAIRSGAADLDLTADGKTDLSDVVQGLAFYKYIEETYPAVYGAMQTLTTDQLNDAYIAELLAGIEAFDETSGIGETEWRKCVEFTKKLEKAGYDPRQFAEIADPYLYSDLGINSENADLDALEATCEALDEAMGRQYRLDIITDAWGYLLRCEESPEFTDYWHSFREETSKLGMEDEDIAVRFEACYTLYTEKAKAGNISDIDVNADGRLNYLDTFILDVYIEDVLGGFPAESSILPTDIWNRVDNDLDLDKNGISGDWADIMTIQALVMSCGTDWDDDIEAAINDLCSKKEDARTFVATVMKSGICADKKTGDVNLDGMITAADASEVLGYYASCSVGEEVGAAESARLTLLGDFDNNGTVSAEDASAILSLYAQNSVE